MLTVTFLKSRNVDRRLVLTSVFLQMAMSYGNLPLIVGQVNRMRPRSLGRHRWQRLRTSAVSPARFELSL